MKSHQTSRKVIRIVAGILIPLFLANDLAAAAQANPFTISAPALSQNIRQEIPVSMGVVEDAYQAPKSDRPKKIFLIQDAHTNESCQSNIARILEFLSKNQSAEYIFLEAGTGDDSLAYLRTEGTPESRRETANAWLQKGEMKGAEYLDVISGLPIKLWGVEDKKLYFESVSLYEAIVKGRDEFQQYLSGVDAAIRALKPIIFNPLLLAYDAKNEAYHARKMTATDYVDYLVRQAAAHDLSLKDFPFIEILKKLKKEESAIDFKAANAEQAKLFSSLSPDQMQELSQAAEQFKAVSALSGLGDKDKRTKAFYAMLEEKASAEKTSYPELLKYIAYLKQAGSINLKELLKEQEALESRIYESVLFSDEERSLLVCERGYDKLKSLFDLKLTPDEFQAYRSDRRFNIEWMTGFLNRKITDLRRNYGNFNYLKEGFGGYVSKAEQFYELTRKRDEAFVRSAVEKMENEKISGAVLIAGGYHSPNLKEILKQKNISFVCITPQTIKETNQKRYEKILLERAGKFNKQASSSDSAAAHNDVLPLREVRSLAAELERQIAGEMAPVAAARLAEQTPRIYENPLGSRPVVEPGHPGLIKAVGQIAGWLINKGYDDPDALRIYNDAFARAKLTPHLDGFGKSPDTVDSVTRLATVFLNVQGIFNVYQLPVSANSVHETVALGLTIIREAKGLLYASALYLTNGATSVESSAHRKLVTDLEAEAYPLVGNALTAVTARHSRMALTHPQVFNLLVKEIGSQDNAALRQFLRTHKQQIIRASAEAIHAEHYEALQKIKSYRWARDLNLLDASRINTKLANSRHSQFLLVDSTEQMQLASELELLIGARFRMLNSYFSGQTRQLDFHCFTYILFALLEASDYVDSNAREGMNPESLVEDIFQLRRATDRYLPAAGLILPDVQRLNRETELKIAGIVPGVLKLIAPVKISAPVLPVPAAPVVPVKPAATAVPVVLLNQSDAAAFRKFLETVVSNFEKRAERFGITDETLLALLGNKAVTDETLRGVLAKFSLKKERIQEIRQFIASYKPKSGARLVRMSDDDRDQLKGALESLWYTDTSYEMADVAVMMEFIFATMSRGIVAGNLVPEEGDDDAGRLKTYIDSNNPYNWKSQTLEAIAENPVALEQLKKLIQIVGSLDPSLSIGVYDYIRRFGDGARMAAEMAGAVRSIKDASGIRALYPVTAALNGDASYFDKYPDVEAAVAEAALRINDPELHREVSYIYGRASIESRVKRLESLLSGSLAADFIKNLSFIYELLLTIREGSANRPDVASIRQRVIFQTVETAYDKVFTENSSFPEAYFYRVAQQLDDKDKVSLISEITRPILAILPALASAEKEPEEAVQIKIGKNYDTAARAIESLVIRKTVSGDHLISFVNGLDDSERGHAIHLLSMALYQLWVMNPKQRIDAENSLLALVDQPDFWSMPEHFLEPGNKKIISEKTEIIIPPGRVRTIPYSATRQVKEVGKNARILAVLPDDRQLVSYIAVKTGHVLDSVMSMLFYIDESGPRPRLIIGDMISDAYPFIRQNKTLRDRYKRYPAVLLMIAEEYARARNIDEIVVPSYDSVLGMWPEMNRGLAKYIYDRMPRKYGFKEDLKTSVPWGKGVLSKGLVKKLDPADRASIVLLENLYQPEKSAARLSSKTNVTKYFVSMIGAAAAFITGGLILEKFQILSLFIFGACGVLLVSALSSGFRFKEKTHQILAAAAILLPIVSLDRSKIPAIVQFAVGIGVLLQAAIILWREYIAPYSAQKEEVSGEAESKPKPPSFTSNPRGVVLELYPGKKWRSDETLVPLVTQPLESAPSVMRKIAQNLKADHTRIAFGSFETGELFSYKIPTQGDPASWAASESQRVYEYLQANRHAYGWGLYEMKLAEGGKMLMVIWRDTPGRPTSPDVRGRGTLPASESAGARLAFMKDQLALLRYQVAYLKYRKDEFQMLDSINRDPIPGGAVVKKMESHLWAHRFWAPREWHFKGTIEKFKIFFSGLFALLMPGPGFAGRWKTFYQRGFEAPVPADMSVLTPSSFALAEQIVEAEDAIVHAEMIAGGINDPEKMERLFALFESMNRQEVFHVLYQGISHAYEKAETLTRALEAQFRKEEDYAGARLAASNDDKLIHLSVHASENQDAGIATKNFLSDIDKAGVRHPDDIIIDDLARYHLKSLTLQALEKYNQQSKIRLVLTSAYLDDCCTTVLAAVRDYADSHPDKAVEVYLPLELIYLRDKVTGVDSSPEDKAAYARLHLRLSLGDDHAYAILEDGKLITENKPAGKVPNLIIGVWRDRNLLLEQQSENIPQAARLAAPDLQAAEDALERAKLRLDDQPEDLLAAAFVLAPVDMAQFPSLMRNKIALIRQISTILKNILMIKAMGNDMTSRVLKYGITLHALDDIRLLKKNVGNYQRETELFLQYTAGTTYTVGAFDFKHLKEYVGIAEAELEKAALRSQDSVGFFSFPGENLPNEDRLLLFLQLLQKYARTAPEDQISFSFLSGIRGAGMPEFIRYLKENSFLWNDPGIVITPDQLREWLWAAAVKEYVSIQEPVSLSDLHFNLFWNHDKKDISFSLTVKGRQRAFQIWEKINSILGSNPGARLALVSVRPFEPADMNALLDIWETEFRPTVQNPPTRQQFENFLRPRIAQPQSNHILVALDGGQVVGYATCAVSPDGSMSTIGQTAIKKEYLDKGVYEELTIKALEWLTAKTAIQELLVLSKNDRNNAALLKLGFKELMPGRFAYPMGKKEAAPIHAPAHIADFPDAVEGAVSDQLSNNLYYRSFLNRHRGQWAHITVGPQNTMKAIAARALARAGESKSPVIQVVIGGASTGEEFARAYHEIASWLKSNGYTVAKKPGEDGWRIRLIGYEIGSEALSIARDKIAGTRPFVWSLQDGVYDRADVVAYSASVLATLREHAEAFKADTTVSDISILSPDFFSLVPDPDLAIFNNVFYQLQKDESRRFLTDADKLWPHTWLAMTASDSADLLFAKAHAVYPFYEDGAAGVPSYLLAGPGDEKASGIIKSDGARLAKEPARPDIDFDEDKNAFYSIQEISTSAEPFKDAEAVRDLWSQTMQGITPGTPSEYLSEIIDSIDNRSKTVFVARHKSTGQIIGVGRAKYNGYTGVLELLESYVAPSYRMKGIAQALFLKRMGWIIKTKPNSWTLMKVQDASFGGATGRVARGFGFHEKSTNQYILTQDDYRKWLESRDKSGARLADNGEIEFRYTDITDDADSAKEIISGKMLWKEIGPAGSYDEGPSVKMFSVSDLRVDGNILPGTMITWDVFENEKTVIIKYLYPSFPRDSKKGRGMRLISHLFGELLRQDEFSKYAGYDIVSVSSSDSFIKSWLHMPAQFKPSVNDTEHISNEIPVDTLNRKDLYDEELWREFLISVKRANIHGVMPGERLDRSKPAARLSRAADLADIIKSQIPEKITAGDKTFEVKTRWEARSDGTSENKILLIRIDIFDGKTSIAHADFSIREADRTAMMNMAYFGGVLALEVSKRYRTEYKGIGTSLMAMAIKTAKAYGDIDKFYVNPTTESESFYLNQIKMASSFGGMMYFPLTDDEMVKRQMVIPNIEIKKRVKAEETPAAPLNGSSLTADAGKIGTVREALTGISEDLAVGREALLNAVDMIQTKLSATADGVSIIVFDANQFVQLLPADRRPSRKPWKIIYLFTEKNGSAAFESFAAIYGDAAHPMLSIADAPLEYFQAQDELQVKKLRKDFSFVPLNAMTADDAREGASFLRGSVAQIIARPGSEKAQVLERWAMALVDAKILGRHLIAAPGDSLSLTDINKISALPGGVMQRLPLAVGVSDITSLGDGTAAALVALAQIPYARKQYFPDAKNLLVMFWGDFSPKSCAIVESVINRHGSHSGIEIHGVMDASGVFLNEKDELSLSWTFLRRLITWKRQGNLVADFPDKDELQKQGSFQPTEKYLADGAYASAHVLVLDAKPHTFTENDARRFSATVFIEAAPNVATDEAVTLIKEQGKLLIPYSTVNIGRATYARQEVANEIHGVAPEDVGVFQYSDQITLRTLSNLFGVFKKLERAQLQAAAGAPVPEFSSLVAKLNQQLIARSAELTAYFLKEKETPPSERELIDKMLLRRAKLLQNKPGLDPFLALQLVVFEQVYAEMILYRLDRLGDDLNADQRAIMRAATLEELKKDLSGENDTEKMIAAYRLGSIPADLLSESEKRDIIRLLGVLLENNQYYRVRAQAARALGRLDGPESVAYLKKAFQNYSEVEPLVREWILQALRESGADFIQDINLIEKNISATEAEVDRLIERAVAKAGEDEALVGIQGEAILLAHEEFQLGCMYYFHKEFIRAKECFEKAVHYSELSKKEGGNLPYATQAFIAAIYHELSEDSRLYMALGDSQDYQKKSRDALLAILMPGEFDKYASVSLISFNSKNNFRLFFQTLGVSFVPAQSLAAAVDRLLNKEIREALSSAAARGLGPQARAQIVIDRFSKIERLVSDYGLDLPYARLMLVAFSDVYLEAKDFSPEELKEARSLIRKTLIDNDGKTTLAVPVDDQAKESVLYRDLIESITKPGMQAARLAQEKLPEQTATVPVSLNSEEQAALESLLLEQIERLKPGEHSSDFALFLSGEKPDLFFFDRTSGRQAAIWMKGSRQPLATVTGDLNLMLNERRKATPESQSLQAARGIMALIKAAKMNADMALAAEPGRAPLAHDVSLKDLRGIKNVKTFDAQVKILISQIRVVRETKDFKNDVFYLGGIETLEFWQRELVNESIHSAGISGFVKTDGIENFDGIVMKYVSTDSLTAVPSQQDERTLIVPVTGIEPDSLLGWYGVFKIGGTLGSVFAPYYKEKTIDFSQVSSDKIPDRAVAFFRTRGEKITQSLLLEMAKGGIRDLGRLKELSFYLPIAQRIPIDAFVQTARMVQQQVASAA